VLFLCNLFPGFVANLESIYKASRNNSEMREIRSELAIVLKAWARFRSRKALTYVGQQYLGPSERNSGTINARESRLHRQAPLQCLNHCPRFVVTIDVSLAIVRHWKTYDSLGKFLGIVLLLNLVIVPLTRTIKFRRGEKPKPEILVQTAYIWLLLATLLFNR
jgi:hypothetical protein